MPSEREPHKKHLEHNWNLCLCMFSRVEHDLWDTNHEKYITLYGALVSQICFQGLNPEVLLKSSYGSKIFTVN